MAYRQGNRNQMHLLPPCIEEYVTPADPVRAYNAFVESLDLDELGIIGDEHKVGNSAQTGGRLTEYNFPGSKVRLWIHRIGLVEQS